MLTIKKSLMISRVELFKILGYDFASNINMVQKNKEGGMKNVAN